MTSFEIEEKSRKLFMRYALPCAGTLVKRCSISQDKVDSWIEMIRKDVVPPKGSELTFKVAVSACTLIAMENGKKIIDEEVIRDYYLFRHDSMIDRRYEEMGDFDPVACRIRSGVVEHVADGFALVKNALGVHSYRTDYCPVSKGDLVTTHWDFVVEKIDRHTAERMNAQKEALMVI
jgi:hypothetical protein